MRVPLVKENVTKTTMISNLPFQLTSYKGGDGGDSAAGAAAVDHDDEAFIIAAVAWFRIDDLC